MQGSTAQKSEQNGFCLIVGVMCCQHMGDVGMRRKMCADARIADIARGFLKRGAAACSLGGNIRLKQDKRNAACGAERCTEVCIALCLLAADAVVDMKCCDARLVFLFLTERVEQVKQCR